MLLETIANFGVLIFLPAAGLGVFLYTRRTAQRTIAAGAYGLGTLLISLFALVLYLNGAQGSTEPLVATATRLRWWALSGTVLLGLGLWLRRLEV